MTRRITALVLLLVLSGTSQAAPKPLDDRARNIFELFMRHNPKLSQSQAKNYTDIVLDASAKYKQDPYVIAAIIVHESTVNNKAVSKGGDYGLMQIRWKYHDKAVKQEFPKVKNASDMFDAKVNIFYGTKLFAWYLNKAKGNLKDGLMGYSAGGTKLTTKVLATVKELQDLDKKTKRRQEREQARKGK